MHRAGKGGWAEATLSGLKKAGEAGPAWGVSASKASVAKPWAE